MMSHPSQVDTLRALQGNAGGLYQSKSKDLLKTLRDFNAHSPVWRYSDTNEAGRTVRDFLSSTTFELLCNKKDPRTYLYYNGKSTTPDLLIVTADLSLTKRTNLKDPGSGSRQVLAETEIPNTDQRPFPPSKIAWDFKETNWTLFTELGNVTLGMINLT
ncbi:hypothetical protein TNIN_76531 [Trichonephila inaurata madagascariensis]|uniref:Endonuclease/exonuclease/phosphatase domain-containing protein n=1 Tax=Trichonephila inaurata madagascariensis TaxID=2747483 RepID=A0A8X6YP22_9ARAC|nr:hypothetical protein TNIN_76531 [Trichonephila inaurata madagascariensis]